MTEPLHHVDPETCLADGICVDVCPERVLEIRDGMATTVESRAAECIECGQCVAVCPTESIQISALAASDFAPLARRAFGYREFYEFLRRRRSVRRFKDRPVARDLVAKILAAAATAPMGLPPHSTAVVVIDRRAELDLLLAELVEDYGSLVRRFANPLGRALVRLASGPEYRTLKNHAVAIARRNNLEYRRDGVDRYMYRAPLVLLFHASRRALSYEENAHLVCHHAMLAALSLGLGTTIIGLIPPIVDRSKKLRQRYGIPPGHRVVTSLIAGHPRYRYRRGIRRDLAGVSRI